MPTSATRTCSRRPNRSGGFTLLEVLVVIVMVAVLTGTVMLGFTGADTEQRLRGSAEQLAYAIELGRQYALQRNREWGLYVDEDAVRFAEFDPEQQTWVEQTGRPFGDAEALPNVIDVRVLGAIGGLELDRPVDLRAATPAAVERGVWLRPFRNLIYVMPPYVIEPEDLSRLTAAIALGLPG